jgi:hypothetical protein
MCRIYVHLLMADWSPDGWQSAGQTDTQTAEETNRAKFDWFRKAAVADNAQAQFLLALMYGGLMGHGYASEAMLNASGHDASPSTETDRPVSARLASTPLDPESALAWQMRMHWLSAAAEQGYAPAQYALGCLYRDGELTSDMVDQERERVLRKRLVDGQQAESDSDEEDDKAIKKGEIIGFQLSFARATPDARLHFARRQMVRWWKAAAAKVRLVAFD